MHINILIDSTLGLYLPTFKVSSKLAEKWRSYHRGKVFFRLKSVRRDPWPPMHIALLMDLSLGWYLPTFQVSSNSVEKWQSYRRRKQFFRPKSLKREGWSVTNGHPCISRSRGTEAHPTTYPHSKFHEDWSRNAQVMIRKHQTLMTEDRRQIGTWVEYRAALAVS